MSRRTREVRCPEHKDAPLVEDYAAGDRICSACGLVVGDRVIDVRTEWRTFGNNDKKKNNFDPNRVGAARDPLLDGSELSTMVGSIPGQRGGGLYGHHDHGGTNSLQQWNTRSGMSGTARSLISAFKQIALMADRLHVKQVIVDRAKKLYKQVDDTGQLKGRAHDAIGAACLYIACRQEGVPRTFKEICAVAEIPKKSIGRCYQAICKALESNLSGLANIKTDDYMSRFCSHLDLPRPTQIVARHIGKLATEVGVVAGKSPISVTAAAIFMAAQALPATRLPAKQVGEVAGVTEQTIRLAYREMYPIRLYLFPADFRGTNWDAVVALPDLGAPLGKLGKAGPVRVIQRLRKEGSQDTRLLAALQFDPALEIKAEKGTPKIEPKAEPAAAASAASAPSAAAAAAAAPASPSFLFLLSPCERVRLSLRGETFGDDDDERFVCCCPPCMECARSRHTWS
eukprot:m.371944 g.371944  ORF g.371944 m.371944 type:complete len:456 (+) comp19992_c0_seq13:305-1672(+)